MSDIHGNFEYLRVILEDIKKQEPDKIYICGDLALMGKNPQETLDVIIELSKQPNVSIVRGNCDEMMIKAHKKGEKILRNEQIAFLESLPEQHTEQIGNLKFLLVHGSPKCIAEYMYPDLTEQTLKEILFGVEENIIICGHTHIPHVREINGKTIINPGSVGRPPSQKPYPSYAILNYSDLSTKDFTLSHKFIK